MSAPDTTKTTYLWPAWSRIAGGQIVMKTTGYDCGNHWTGERPVGSTEDPFWSWCFSNRQLLPPIMNESFLPALQGFWKMELASSTSGRATLIAPKDGNYVFLLTSSSEAERALIELFKHFGKNAFIPIPDAKPPELFSKFLLGFCRGLAEVFCFRNGKCDFFAALGDDFAVLPEHLAMLEKRILRQHPH